MAVWFLDDSDWRGALSRNVLAPTATRAVHATPANPSFYPPEAVVNPNPSVAWVSPQSSSPRSFTFNFRPSTAAPAAPRGDTVVLAQVVVMGTQYQAPSGYGSDMLRHSIPNKPTLTAAIGSDDATSFALHKLTFDFYRVHASSGHPRVWPCSFWRGALALTRSRADLSGTFTLTLTLTHAAPGGQAVLYIGRVMHGTRLKMDDAGFHLYQDRGRSRIINAGAPRVRGRYPNTRRQQGSVARPLVFRNVQQAQFERLYDLALLAGDHNPIAFYSDETYHTDLLYGRISRFEWEDETVYKHVTMELEETPQAAVEAAPINEDTTE